MARQALAGVFSGKISLLWAASMALGVARRSLARLGRCLVFACLVKPVFFLTQLLVYAAVRLADGPPGQPPGKEPRLPEAAAGNGRVAVVIPNYRGEHFLRGLLESLGRQTWKDLEVLVVDNDSRDGSEAIVRQFPGVRWIPTGANLGFAHAVNRGAREAGDAEFLALLNNDTEVEPDWARRQVEALRNDPRLGAVGARIYQRGFQRRINVHAHTLGSDLRSYNVGAGADDHGQFDGDQRVLGVSGCSMMIRAQAFHEAGGFDERFFLCYEDVDFSLRLFWRGWQCRVVPEAVCHHVSNAHLGTGSALHVRNILLNDLFWVAKNIPSTLMRGCGAGFLGFVLRGDELRLFYHWQGAKIVLWRLQSLVNVLRGLGARAAIRKTRVQPAEALLAFIRPMKELQVRRLYQIDLAERYLVSQPEGPDKASRCELMPQNLLAAAGFENADDVMAGREAVTASDDPQVCFRLEPAQRRFRWIDVEMTCDRTDWAQLIVQCRRRGRSYYLASNHFRVLPGRRRYGLAVNGRFFHDGGPVAPDLFGYWREDLVHLRLDPCESAGTHVAIHSFGVS